MLKIRLTILKNHFSPVFFVDIKNTSIVLLLFSLVIFMSADFSVS